MIVLRSCVLSAICTMYVLQLQRGAGFQLSAGNKHFVFLTPYALCMHYSCSGKQDLSSRQEKHILCFVCRMRCGCSGKLDFSSRQEKHVLCFFCRMHYVCMTAAAGSRMSVLGRKNTSCVFVCRMLYGCSGKFDLSSQQEKHTLCFVCRMHYVCMIAAAGSRISVLGRMRCNTRPKKSSNDHEGVPRASLRIAVVLRVGRDVLRKASEWVGESIFMLRKLLHEML